MELVFVLPARQSPLFTSFQLLNDECLLASREFATKQKFRREKHEEKTLNVFWGLDKILFRDVSPSTTGVTFMSEWLDINWRKGIDSIQPNVFLI